MSATRLPPLRALQSFVATAKHAGFARAAIELNVCAQAVGLQVRSLESHLQCRLFERVRGRLVLTPAGHGLYLELARAFEVMAHAVETHRTGTHSRQLTVAATPAFAALCLVPRLGAFRRDHPRLEVRVLTLTAPLGALDNGADCAIVFGGDVPAGLVAEEFMTEAILPVCAPAPLNDRNGYELLHDDSPDRDPALSSWTAWQEAVGGLKASAGLRFDDPVLGLAAAQAGLGVWLARARLAVEPLTAGRLVRPFGPAKRSACAYRLATSPAAAARPMVRAFRQWLESEAAAAPELPT
jgi:LysR family glycine cleavage system transcriptional activator